MKAVPTLALDVPRIARVVDFETTGKQDDENAAICEAAFVDVDLTDPILPVGQTWTSLFNPGHPIPPETMAIHHITDADVADAPLAYEAGRHLAGGLTEYDVYVAHKAEFEKHFYSKRPQKWVCTYKCALRAWPDAPGHSNQTLRYHLKLDLDPELAQPPHRALPDAYVTAHILRQLLLRRPIERLIQISAQPGYLPKFTFGKHRGKTFREVAAIDRSYLQWIVEKSELDGDVKFTARQWLQTGGA